jgi:pyruvate/2-oxoglutarate dehydrogenase complex dihydrolipoamide dehydrogenase (E3) component
MEAARTLAQRGHETSLFESSDRLGGQWNILSNFLPEESKLVQYLSTSMLKAGVKVHLNQEVTVQFVREKKPDAVVVATGSTSAVLDIPGIQGKNVVQATDILTGRVEAGKEVVVIGGRIVGLDAALFLTERGKRVSVVTRSSIGRGIVHNLRATLFEYLVKSGVHLYNNTVPDSITEQGVNCWWNGGDATARENLFFFLPADTIVLAVGAVNTSQLGDDLSGLMSEVYKIGDCAGKRSIFAALRGGSEVGRKI